MTRKIGKQGIGNSEEKSCKEKLCAVQKSYFALTVFEFCANFSCAQNRQGRDNKNAQLE